MEELEQLQLRGINMDLYAELGRIQFQMDKLEAAKTNIVRQIEIQMTIKSVKQQDCSKEEVNQDEPS